MTDTTDTTAVVLEKEILRSNYVASDDLVAGDTYKYSYIICTVKYLPHAVVLCNLVYFLDKYHTRMSRISYSQLVLVLCMICTWFVPYTGMYDKMYQ